MPDRLLFRHLPRCNRHVLVMSPEPKLLNLSQYVALRRMGCSWPTISKLLNPA